MPRIVLIKHSLWPKRVLVISNRLCLELEQSGNMKANGARHYNFMKRYLKYWRCKTKIKVFYMKWSQTYTEKCINISSITNTQYWLTNSTNWLVTNENLVVYRKLLISRVNNDNYSIIRKHILATSFNFVQQVCFNLIYLLFFWFLLHAVQRIVQQMPVCLDPQQYLFVKLIKIEFIYFFDFDSGYPFQLVIQFTDLLLKPAVFLFQYFYFVFVLYGTSKILKGLYSDIHLLFFLFDSVLSMA